MSPSMDFTAIAEARPGPKWLSRWDWSWPDYEAWFVARGGDGGPTRADCEAALSQHMPELFDTYRQLSQMAGDGDRAARFLSGWCPPAYLGGCTLAAHARGGDVRLVRNYDMSPDLNEGLLFRSEWNRPVMGMVEFLWGLSDGINDAGLCVALAFGGRGTVRPGFGITHIVRYLLETCEGVDDALRRIRRLPSHMAYNLVLTDKTGAVASVELLPGGGMRTVPQAVATNHQSGPETPDRPGFTRTFERSDGIKSILARDPAPSDLFREFLAPPLFQRDYQNGFGTLFTADYDPATCGLRLHWPSQCWEQRLDAFEEGCRRITFQGATPEECVVPMQPPSGETGPDVDADWAEWGMQIARSYMSLCGLSDLPGLSAGLGFIGDEGRPPHRCPARG